MSLWERGCSNEEEPNIEEGMSITGVPPTLLEAILSPHGCF